MAGLHYKTRSDNLYQRDLPKVYFCCHPDDFLKHFDVVSDDILRLVDCSVWYADADTPRNEEFFSILSEMDLVVVPVTERLLTDDTAVMEKDIPFALSTTHNGKNKSAIPLLPLMQDRFAEKAYQSHELLKGIQYLFKDADDANVRPYEEKLREYLDRVLINRELVEKVRGAFDAYIFISYRKKDRKIAQNLMELIHRQSFCRSIALWYDEYLPTGEDFYSSIQEILDKSALFVLSFTSSVLEDQDGEPNFVIKEEIPSAYEKVRIVTVRMDETADPTALVEKLRSVLGDVADFEQIRQMLCVVSKGDEAVGQALLDQLKKVPQDKLKQRMQAALDGKRFGQNDGDPEHDYLIGLAYLHGVDTIKDADLACELLEFASKSGLVEATEKLVDMYRCGNGVQQNTVAAIGLQERLISQYEQCYRADPSKEALHKVLWAYIECGNMLYDIAEVTPSGRTAADQYKAVAQYDLGVYAADVMIQRDIGIAIGYLGEIYTATEEYTEAISVLEKASLHFLEIAAENPYCLPDMANTYLKLAEAHLRNAGFDAEKDNCTAAIDACDHCIQILNGILSVTPGDIQAHRTYAKCMHTKARILCQYDDYEEMRRCLSAAEEHIRCVQFDPSFRETGDFRDLCATQLYLLGGLNGDQGLLRKALVIYEALAKDYPGIVRYHQCVYQIRSII